MIEWTNHSALLMAGDRDPVPEITERARTIVLNAMELGWSGPPFDPFALAEILGVRTEPSNNVMDARVLSRDGVFLIEYNPNKTPARIRYSVAHELGHTLFPDCDELVRNRVALVEATDDEWQLELLCNVAAAEFVMPIGALPPGLDNEITVEGVLEAQRDFGVSTEAVLLRIMKVSQQSAAAFAASKLVDEPGDTRYRLDYLAGSRSFPRFPGFDAPLHSAILGHCNAVGMKSRGFERWPGVPADLWIECIGVPAFPGHAYPRVVGFVRPESGQTPPVSGRAGIQYVNGDAFYPKSEGRKLLAFIVNDQAKKWGGGFAAEVRRKWPTAQEAFELSGSLELGSIHSCEVAPDLSTVALVAQHGYRQQAKPGIRYGALNRALGELAHLAAQQGASIHMPEIGIGQARGNWSVIAELVEERLVQHQLAVTVYQRPGVIRLDEQLPLDRAADMH